MLPSQREKIRRGGTRGESSRRSQKMSAAKAATVKISRYLNAQKRMTVLPDGTKMTIQ